MASHKILCGAGAPLIFEGQQFYGGEAYGFMEFRIDFTQEKIFRTVSMEILSDVPSWLDACCNRHDNHVISVDDTFCVYQRNASLCVLTAYPNQIVVEYCEPQNNTENINRVTEIKRELTALYSVGLHQIYKSSFFFHSPTIIAKALWKRIFASL